MPTFAHASTTYSKSHLLVQMNRAHPALTPTAARHTEDKTFLGSAPHLRNIKTIPSANFKRSAHTEKEKRTSVEYSKKLSPPDYRRTVGET